MRHSTIALILALLVPLAACGWVEELPRGDRPYFAWNGALSNADQGPAAPLFIPSPDNPLPLIEVTFPKAPGTLPRRFIIDTGASVTLISQDLKNTLALRCRPLLSPPPRGPDTLCRIPQLNFGDVHLRSIPVGVVDAFPPVGSAESTVTIDGILGLNVLSQLAVVISPSRGQVQILPSGSPLPGDRAPLGEERHRVLTVGDLGPRALDNGEEAMPAEGVGPGSVDGELSWAPILVPQGEGSLAPPEVLSEDERPLLMPRGGPHLFALATGRSRSFLRPDLILWAAGDGVLATVAAPQDWGLAEELTREILDEPQPGPKLTEATRYILPHLEIGPMSLGPISMDQGDEAWTSDPLSGILGADLLSRYDIGMDLKGGRLELRPIPPGSRPPTMQGRLIAWAESALAPEQTHYPTLEEAMARFVSVGRWPDAAIVADRMVKQNPSAVSAWIVLAMNAEREGDLAKGIELYRRLYWVPQGREAGILGASRLALLQGDFTEALRDLHSVEADDPKGRARMWRVRGLMFLFSGDDDTALTSFRRSLSRGQEDGIARVALGWFAYRDGDLEAAREHFNFALMESPDDPFTLKLMVATMRQLGLEDEIDDWISTLAGYFPNPSPDGRDPLGPLRIRILRERGERAAMTQLLKEQLKAQQAESSRTPSPKQRAIALEMQARLLLAARHDLQGALDLAGQAQEADPAGTRGLMVGAEILRLLDGDNSHRAYRSAWERRPLNLEAWLAKAGTFIPDLAPTPPPPPPPPKRKKRRNRRDRYLPSKIVK